ncbi:4Fe-4S binding protein [bacterium]|nr:4Fe-4S binding protein [bacterium]MBU0900277.1 4Fe-4S binding protein [bacterium]MBU1152597.1 4Fe-4S binding protein [bacterium]MBU1782520.1 4Fe-4S binding protein [bacterium]MBU2600289.1 4Fe-4S binding protein [bacterium]
MIKKRMVLTFPKETIEQPITYHLIKDYDLMVNILSAKINPNEKGRMVLEISGKKGSLDKGIDYLKNLRISIQPLAKDVRWNEERCIHCSACIPLCPSRALSIDRDKMKISFNSERCIVCGFCLKACPYQAIEILF